MKNLFRVMLFAAVAAFAATGCSDNGKDPEPNPTPAPTFSWEGQDINAVHQITLNADGDLDYTADIKITALGKIAGLTVDITSDALVGVMGISKLDLVNPDETMLGVLKIATGLPYGEQVLGKTECDFDITTLLPIIAAMPAAAPGSEHDFAVTVTDELGQSTPQLLRFQKLPAPDVAGPSFSWEGGDDIDAVHPITLDADGNLTYTAALDIAAPATIDALTVDITSDALNGMGITSLDLVNDEGIAMGPMTIPFDQLGLIHGDQIQGQSECTLDVSGLIPMIVTTLHAASGSQHTFTVNVTDADGNTASQPLTFQVPEATTPDGPSFSWPGQDINAVHNVADIGTGAGQYAAAITISAPGKIATLTVDLPAGVAGMLGGISTLDIANPGAMKTVLDQFGISNGDAVLGQTSCIFDITGLIPMLSMIPGLTGEQDFTVNVADELGQSQQQVLRFQI